MKYQLFKKSHVNSTMGCKIDANFSSGGKNFSLFQTMEGSQAIVNSM